MANMNNAKKMGISQDTRTTSRKEFTPVKEKHDGLNLAKIVNVEIVYSAEPIKDDSSMVIFRGLNQPALVLHFEGAEGGGDAPYTTERFTPFVPNSEAENDYQDNMFQKIKHYIEAYKGEGRLTQADYDKLVLDYSKHELVVGEEMEYGTAINAAYVSFFNGVIDVFCPQAKEGDEPIKAIYEDVVVYFKMTYYTNRNTGKSRLVIPMYVGKGIIEKARYDNHGKLQPAAKIKIEIGKGETIVEPVAIKMNSSVASPGGVSNGQGPIGGDASFMDEV